MKIIDLIKAHSNSNEQRISLEFFPPKGSNFDAFYELANEMLELNPLFLDVTWGTGEPESTSAIDIAYGLAKRTQYPTMLHVPSCHRSTQKTKKVLDKLQSDGEIKNIFALTGNPSGRLESDEAVIETATDLVRLIRKNYGDNFGIGVAGYPDGHLNEGQAPSHDFYRSPEYKKQLDDLKVKIDAGADYIITQLIFEMDNVARFRDSCVQLGIDKPIIPGLLPIHNAFAYNRIAKPSAVMPQSLSEFYDQFDFNDSKGLLDFGAELLIKQLDKLKSEGFNIVQIFTMNRNTILKQALIN